ncbi:unnamed protein product [Diamesa serratosioi]
MLKSNYILSFITFTRILNFISGEKYLPILYWHSAGETCCGKEGNLYINFLKSQLDNDVYIKSVRIGKTVEQDKINSITRHPFDQLKYVCKQIQENPKFKNGYNGVGLSQGALLLRGLVETCPFPRMQVMISLGGPQQGVAHLNKCKEQYETKTANCSILQKQANALVYKSFFQRHLVPTTYWHDPRNERGYQQGSTFLAVINNERVYNPSYVKNLQSLKKFVLLKWLKDLDVVPVESTWFGFYGKNGTVLPLVQTELYTKNKLGLKQMHNDGKLVFLQNHLAHLELDEPWFKRNIIPYLKLRF